ncbi:MAG: hypothetical protein FJW27_13430 [Acidimicrobiia bacterium]|nr:hypothetical protein [Acidimicrobiia bacterium]
MAKKNAVKQTQATRRFSPAAIIGIVVAVAAIGAVLLWPSSNTAPQPTPEMIASAAAKAAVGPHKQASYPPIPFQAYTPPRSQDVVAAAYRFAAEHPEITSYVPCFCGCERAGHQGNTDCFVKQRDANGDVIAWDEHGLDCAVCIDVATVARQMHASGASVRDIRAAIDKQFGSLYPGTMPTPHPPAAHPTN